VVGVSPLELLGQLDECRAVTGSRFMERCGEAEAFLAGEGAHRILELCTMAIGQIVTQISIDQRFHPNLRWIGDRCSLVWITPGGGTASLQAQMFLQMNTGKPSAPTFIMKDEILRM
jgi:hypothetical protein